ncbi:hypothetical protein [Sphingomonas sp. PAMC 26605]|uniref:hypothetical protein n=1 Tax=Sphingomonas sp. PAMC 26605 TaxID=1112214 RepID=UPI0012F4F9C2|nr:hypothetical protein [Sphingomonas sp. PAMC 26605]
MTIFFLSCFADIVERGQVRVLPLAYSRIAAYLSQRLHIDVAIAHVSPPDSTGFASLGIAADFAELAFISADRIAVVVNPQMPRIPRSPQQSLREADVVVDLPSPLVAAAQPGAYADIDRIAILVADRCRTAPPFRSGSVARRRAYGASAAVIGISGSHRGLSRTTAADWSRLERSAYPKRIGRRGIWRQRFLLLVRATGSHRNGGRSSET